MRPGSPWLPSSVVRDELDAKLGEEVEVEQLRRASRAVEERDAGAAGAQAAGEHGKRREPDTAGHQPGLDRWLDECERLAERTEARQSGGRAAAS